MTLPGDSLRDSVDTKEPVRKGEDAPVTRRTFLSRSMAITSIAAAGTLVGGRGLWAEPTPPSDRLGLALIGTGGMGRNHLAWFHAQGDVEIVALCDVDERHLQEAKSILGKAACPTFRDYREVLDQDGVDAVLIATPDHWHGMIAVDAANAGKHIYCEKPLTNSVAEGRAVCTAVKKNGVVLQTGSHERSLTGAKLAKRIVDEKRLGEIREVRIQLPVDEPHHQTVRTFAEELQPTEPPPELNFDFWLGHTPAVPYYEKRCHFWWRFIHHYGGGEMTDRGAHVIDLAQMILGRDDTGPVRFVAKGERPKSRFYDTFLDFEFENTYADGLRMLGSNQGPRGLWLIGSEAKLFVGVHGAVLSSEPASLLDGLDGPETPPYDGHRREFLEAIRSGGQVVAPAEAGHRTASICHLNNLAMQLGREIVWDPVSERAADDEVQKRLLPEMREPWRAHWTRIAARK